MIFLSRDHADQKKRPPDDNFMPFTMEEWLSMSATHKNLSGSLRCPLPPELEPTERPNFPGFISIQLLSSPHMSIA